MQKPTCWLETRNSTYSNEHKWHLSVKFGFVCFCLSALLLCHLPFPPIAARNGGGAELSILGGSEEGGAVCDARGLAAGGAPLEAGAVLGGLHGGGLRQRHVVEVGQADVVPKALPHVYPVVQGVQFLCDVAPD